MGKIPYMLACISFLVTNGYTSRNTKLKPLWLYTFQNIIGICFRVHHFLRLILYNLIFSFTIGTSPCPLIRLESFLKEVFKTYNLLCSATLLINPLRHFQSRCHIPHCMVSILFLAYFGNKVTHHNSILCILRMTNYTSSHLHRSVR